MNFVAKLINFIEGLIEKLMPTPTENLAANSDKVSYTSYYETDKIVVSKAEPVHSGGESFDGVGADLLPIAIYTLDSGTSWQDCVYASTFSGFTLASGSTECFLSYSAGNVTFIFQSTGGSNNGVKFVGLAQQDSVISDTFVTGKTAYNTSNNYMKIALEGTYSKASGSGVSTTTVAHNLGYLPMVNVWIKDTTYFSPASWRRPFCQGDTSAISEGVRVDSTNIYITTNQTTDTTVYYRIYYEN